MKKYVKAKELLATKAENKEKKPVYATRKLSIGLVSFMLGLVLLAPRSMADENKSALEAQAIEQTNTPQAGPKANENAQPVSDQNSTQGEKGAENQQPAANQPQVDKANPAETPAPVSQQGQPGQAMTPETKKEASGEKTSQPTDPKAEKTGKEENTTDTSKKTEESAQKGTEGDKKTEAKTPADKKEAEKKKVSVKPEDVLSEAEIEAIRQRTNNLDPEKSYFFNGNMEEELRAKIVAALEKNPNADLNELKKTLIAEAIVENTQTQKALGQDRAGKINISIKGADKLKSGDKEVIVEGIGGTEQGQIIDVLVNNVVKGSFTQPKRVKKSAKIKLEDALQKDDKVKAVLKSSDGSSIIASTDEYTTKESNADKYKNNLKMPSTEIWIENTSSNLVNEDEKAEALDLLKKANSEEIANNISSIDFKIEGDGEAKTASYTITYKDKSKSDKISAPNLNIVQVKEYSQKPEIQQTYIADGTITIKLKEKVKKGSKIGIMAQIADQEKKNFCDEGSCKNTKFNTDWTTVDADTDEITIPIKDDFLELGREFGVVVKEYRKFASCKLQKPEIKIPNVGVRDPKNLTETEKDKIREEIRKANTTTSGKSKLPDWNTNGDLIPAIIEFDKDGNVKIIDPSKVDADWEDDYTKFVPKKNPDGSIKMSTGDEDKKIPIEKDKLVTNLAPEVPDVKVDKGNVIVTPNKLDTDAQKVTVTYTGTDGTSKTVTATKGKDGNWTTDDLEVKVNNDGVVSLPTSKVQSNSIVNATVTDNGGISQNDTEQKSSTAGSTVVTATVQTPAVKVDETTGDVTVTPKDNDPDAKRMDITYTPAGSDDETTVTAKKGEDGKWSIEGKTEFTPSEDGKSFTIKNAKVKAKTKVKAITKGESDELKSGEASDTVPDKTAPQPPAVAVITNDGSAHITPPSDKDTKTVTVKYLNPEGNEKTAVATKGDDGWKITQGNEDGVVFDKTGGFIKIPYDKMKKADTVSAIAKDESNNESQSSTDTTLPPVPSVEVNTDKKVVVTPPADRPAVNGMEITYIPAGENEAKTIKITKGNDDNWKLDGDSITGINVDENTGKVTFEKGTAKELSNVTAKSKIDENKKGLETAEKQVPDKTAPEAPEVKVQKDGSVTITPKKDSDTKTVTVTYKDQDGHDKTATATKGDNGEWTVTGDNGETIDKTTGVITIPKGKSNPGDKVEAKAKDPSENESGPSEDTTKPAPPTITPDQKSGNVTITPPTKGKLDGMDIEYQTPGGETRKVRAKKDNNTWTIDGANPDGVTIDDKGVVTIPKGKAKEKTEVKANSTLGEKKAPAEKTPENQHQVPDKTAPEKPEVKVQKDGSVTITPKKDSDTKTVTVTYKDQDGHDKTATATKGDNGEWTVTGDNGETIDKTTGVITIPKGKSNPGDKVEAKAKDPSENESGPSEDTTKPAPPTITPDQKSGNVTITPPTKGKLDGMDIEYQTPGGETRKVRAKKDNNTWTIDGANPDGVTIDDKGVVTIPKGKAKEKTEVKANSTLGEKKAPAEKTPENQHQVPDKTAPNPPTVGITDNGNVTITPPADKDTTSVTVTYKGKDGSEKTAIATKGADGWKMTKAENGESVVSSSGLITIPKGNYQTQQKIEAYGNDNAKNKSNTNDKTPVEVTIDVNGGKQQMAGAIRVQGGSYVLPAIFAPEYYPENKEFAGWQVGDDTELKQANASIKVNKDIKIKAIWKDKKESTPDQTPDEKPGETPDQTPGEEPTPGQTPEVTPGKDSSPGTPGFENPKKDDPTTPDKANPKEPAKPGETPEKPQTPKKPIVEKGDKVIKKGNSEIVIPKEAQIIEKGKLSLEQRTKIAEKIKEKNPDLVDVKIDENSNAFLSFSDGRKEKLLAKELASKEGFVIPKRDKHVQDESPLKNKRADASPAKHAGKNVKTGIESLAGIALTLVGSTGALLISRKKEDEE